MHRIESFWDWLVKDATRVVFSLVLIGLALTIVSFGLNLHDVVFNGRLIDGTEILGPKGNQISPKQVGFIWAPNWALTGIILLPGAVYYALLARGEVEATIRRLIERQMLVTRDFKKANVDEILKMWKRESRGWTIHITGAFLLAVGLVFFLDFIPVVGWWLLAEPSQIEALVNNPKNPVNIQNDTYEFDWSIAATFENTDVYWLPNLVFAAAAYLVIGILGSGFLLASFIWFASVISFFSKSRLREHGLYLIPDIKSKDPHKRKGFENFEPFFTDLILASIFTISIGVMMHLQNVYLRAPSQTSIVEMIFSDTITKLETAKDLGDVFGVFTSMSEVLEVPASSITMQTYAGHIILILVAFIVFSCIWIWLRNLAYRSVDILGIKENLNEKETANLKKNMNIWPVGWISLNRLIAIFALIAVSMWFVNFIALIILFFIGVAAKQIWDYMYSLFKSNENQDNDR